MKKADKIVADNPLDKVYLVVDEQIDDVIGLDTLDENDKVIKKGKPRRVQCGSLWYSTLVKEKKLYFGVYSTKTTRKAIFEIPADSDGKGYIQTLVYLSKHAGLK